MQKQNGVVIWLLTGCFMVAAMVIIGGITRLTESGLSMVDWNLFTQTFPPLSTEAWIESFNNYKNYPEYKELNYDFTLADYKQIYWWEYIHRLWGRLIGLVFILPFIYFLIKKRLSFNRIKQFTFLFLLGAFQAFLGWYMVKSGLVKEPRVSHFRLAAHLITAFFTFCYILWLIFEIVYDKQKNNKHRFPVIQKAVLIFTILLILQIVYGAFVAGLDAGKMHNNFPKMDENAWIAESVFVLEPMILNFIEGKSGVQFTHRMLAFTLIGLGFWIWFYAKKFPLSNHQKIGVNWLVIALLFQFCLGVFTLLFSVPVVLGVLHQIGALGVLGVTVFVYHRFKFQ